ncbi:MAG: hypothetical protein COV36_00765 [Alphaproteobacteria bacterium CG11_big_fil_rev_8_21_14_0_20_44_7]|nr:MAG: hypothetical protein COV36_00765 [Alphaproteobacteria bacterium CG11_big_fil_rev_8_21_14_0_20_44_7]
MAFNYNNRRNGKKNFSRNGKPRGQRSFGSDIDEENISPQQRRNFSNKRDTHLSKAKDLLSSGDRVEAENHFQHADHYFRMMNLGNDKKPQNNPQNNAQNPQSNENSDDNNNTDSGDKQHNSSEAVKKPKPAPKPRNAPRADNRKPSDETVNNESENSGIADIPFLKGDEAPPAV